MILFIITSITYIIVGFVLATIICKCDKSFYDETLFTVAVLFWFIIFPMWFFLDNEATKKYNPITRYLKWLNK